jgi:hypothetical protein
MLGTLDVLDSNLGSQAPPRPYTPQGWAEDPSAEGSVGPPWEAFLGHLRLPLDGTCPSTASRGTASTGFFDFGA